MLLSREASGFLILLCKRPVTGRVTKLPHVIITQLPFSHFSSFVVHHVHLAKATRPNAERGGELRCL